MRERKGGGDCYVIEIKKRGEWGGTTSGWGSGRSVETS